ncbi:hypothetical protein SynA1560_02468 [Synechococcus sp. A15-60]|nr:hypothetical protein SynA1560_02468 [Synechococcus sp. A15-60]
MLRALLSQSALAQGLAQRRTGAFSEQLLIGLGEVASAAKAKVLWLHCVTMPINARFDRISA